MTALLTAYLVAVGAVVGVVLLLGLALLGCAAAAAVQWARERGRNRQP